MTLGQWFASAVAIAVVVGGAVWLHAWWRSGDLPEHKPKDRDWPT